MRDIEANSQYLYVEGMSRKFYYLNIRNSKVG